MVLCEHSDAEKIIGTIRCAGYDEQSNHWLGVAEENLKETIEYKRTRMLACFIIYKSIHASIKAMLSHERINYEFTRNLEQMYGLLPNQYRYDSDRA